MHPSKLARIHTLQKKRREKKKKKYNNVGRRLIHPGIPNNAGYQTLYTPSCTKSQAQSMKEQPPEKKKEEMNINRSNSIVLSSGSSQTR